MVLIRFLKVWLAIILGVWLSIPSTGLATGSVTIDDIDFVTENYPPYNYGENGELKGIWIDVLVEVLKNMNAWQTRDDIKLLPWARGYRAALSKANTCIFGTVRTKERETLFKWAGPVTQGSYSLIALKNKDIHIDRIEDAARYKIGVVKDDFAVTLLGENGIPEKQFLYFFGENAAHEIVKELNRGNVDLWFIEHTSARWMLKQHKFNARDYKVVFRIPSYDGYFAFNKKTPNHLVEKFQASLENIMGSFVFQDIVNHYLSDDIFP